MCTGGRGIKREMRPVKEKDGKNKNKKGREIYHKMICKKICDAK